MDSLRGKDKLGERPEQIEKDQYSTTLELLLGHEHV